MTGYAQVKGQHDSTAFTISLKSVNHRFLDLHLRLPAGGDLLEQRVRRTFKEKIGRGHVELTLSLEQAESSGISVNREIVAGYVLAFRKMAQEFGLPGEPDLNAIFRMNGALSAAGDVGEDEAFQNSMAGKIEQAIEALNAVREQEGQQIANELSGRLERMSKTTDEIETLRDAVLQAHVQRIQMRMQELVATQADPDRVLQEAAMLAERSDIHEEIVRMKTHIQHFHGLLREGSDVGKKLDFLLQEMNREANTMLSKTTGVAGDALRITELGLALKADIEKAREQVQNVE